LRNPWDLTTVGSLATILWLLILRQRNIEVSGLDYFKVGILVTPLMLVIGALRFGSYLFRRKYMRVLCCQDGTNIEHITRALSTLVIADERIIGLLYITDLGPHQEIERKRERLLRPRHLSGPLYEKMRQAEVASAQDILQEGLRYLPGAQTLSREGNPEREII
jgi:hypothetical protein